MDQQQIHLAFTTNETPQGADTNFVQFVGTNLQFSVADVVQLSGDITVTQRNGELLIGASGMEAFFGSGPARLDEPGNPINPDAIGVLIDNVQLGAVLDSTHNLDLSVSGTASLIGLPGLGFTPSTPFALALKNNTSDTRNLSIPRIQALTTPSSIDFSQGTAFALNLATISTLPRSPARLRSATRVRLA